MCQVTETLLGNSLRLEFPVSLLGAEYHLGDQSEPSNGLSQPIRELDCLAPIMRGPPFISPDPPADRDCEGPSHPVYDENGFKCQPLLMEKE